MDNNYPQNNSENARSSAPQQSGSYEQDPHAQNGYAQNPYTQNGYSQSPYAQNGYAQNPYGQNGYAQNPYDQNGYTQNPYAQNGYTQNPYAQSGYTQNPYAQSAYTQNPYTQNGYTQNPYTQSGYTQNPYDQSAYTQNPYTQNGYAQNPYAQNGYTQNPYAQNGYTQNPYDQSSYTQNPYTQNGYSQNPYDQSGYTQNPGTPVSSETIQPFRPNKKLSLIVTIIAMILEVLLVGAFAVVWFLTPEAEPVSESASEAVTQAADEENATADEDGSSAAALALPEGDGTEADFEHTIIDSTEYGVVHGYDADGNEVWSYESGTYDAPDYDAWEGDGVVGLGEHDGLYYLCEDGGVVALYITDGSVAWRAEDCVGSATDIAFDDDGNAYITSYYGPDLTILSQQGEVLAVEEDLHPQADNPDDIEVIDGTISIHFESGLMDYAAGGTISVPVSDYIG